MRRPEQTAQQLILLADIVEKSGNDTTNATEDLNAEQTAICMTAMQNRLAFDYLLAAQGGTCAVIGSECCTYIHDSSENVTSLVDHICQASANAHNDLSVAPFDWLKKIIGS
ncbi:endogenous retrovirus group 3 member 1 Env polyprotein-like [Arapaima gigas]